jgi:hypothetical protein
MTTTNDTATELQTAPDSRWIQTFTGKAFWPLSPHVAAIDIVDIAHALAMKCRYTGHTRHFYSVAQHCVLAGDVMGELANDFLAGGEVVRDFARWGLLHDATEAYLPDVARPVKKELVGFKEIEDRLMEAIVCRFGLTWPMPAAVKEVDLILLATERRDLMAPPPYRWTSTERVAPLLDPIEPWSPEYAKERFLARCGELDVR